MLGLYFVHTAFSNYVDNVWLRFAVATVLVVSYLGYIYSVEKDNLPKLSRG